MSSQQDFKGIVSLSEEQYTTLSTTGTLTVGDITLTYSPTDTVYVTPDTSSGVIQLVGTETNPINLATDMEVGQIYSCTGVIYGGAPVGNQILEEGFSFLIEKMSAGRVVIFNAKLGSPNIEFDNTNNLLIVYSSDGAISSFSSAIFFNSVNGSDDVKYIYAPITSGTSGQILQSNGYGQAPTWVNLSENNLIRLTGTETDPIDILTDIEAGNLYLCSGYIHLSKQSTAAIDLGTNYILIYMQNDAPAGGFTLIRILDTIFEDNSTGGSFSIYTGVNTTVRILNNAISGYLYSVAPSSINGETTTRDGIFAPTEGGTSGQILQSNGNAEPTWIDFNQGVTTLVGTEDQPINFATSMEVGNYYLITGYITWNSTITYNISYQQLAYKLNDTNIILFNTKGLAANEGPTFGISINVNILETGYVNAMSRDVGIQSINGSIPNNILSGLYVPTTSGNVGQILQSNGPSQAPTWVDMPEQSIVKLVGTETEPINLGTSLTTGNYYLISGFIQYSATTTYNISYQQLVNKISDTEVILYDTTGLSGNPIFGVDIKANLSSTGYINYADRNIGLSSLNGAIPATRVSIYTPTSPGTSGQILQSNGTNNAPTWIDMPSGSGGIIQLTGTAENPINLATSLTVGQLYSCQGVINVGANYSFTSLGETNDNFLLYKWSDTGIYALTCSSSNIDGVTHIFNGYQGICYIIIDTSGNITGVSNANFINLLNGNSNVEPGTPLSIYAPTTSGEAGQLLQSNGADQAPSWNSLSTTISESSTDNEIPSALSVYNLIQNSIVSALGGNY